MNLCTAWAYLRRGGLVVREVREVSYVNVVMPPPPSHSASVMFGIPRGLRQTTLHVLCLVGAL